jgi:hypothetical protein
MNPPRPDPTPQGPRKGIDLLRSAAAAPGDEQPDAADRPGWPVDPGARTGAPPVGEPGQEASRSEASPRVHVGPPAATPAGDGDGDGRAETPRGRLEVNGTQVCASTLASVSGAVVASIFGVTGTVVGAAVGSVIATTGSALYSHGIRRTTEKLQNTPVAELSRRVGTWPRAASDPTEPAARGAGPTRTGPVRSPAAAPGWRAWLKQRRWGLALGMAIVFGATLLAITTIELAGQRSLADITGNSHSGRTSIGSILGDDGSSDDQAPTGSSTTLAPGDTPDDQGTSTDPADDGGTTDTTVGSDTPSDGETPPATDPPADQSSSADATP